MVRLLASFAQLSLVADLAGASRSQDESRSIKLTPGDGRTVMSRRLTSLFSAEVRTSAQ